MRNSYRYNRKATDKKIEIKLAIPGLKKEDFKIELHRKIVAITS
ncbi:Hsp20 family protein [Flavobacterium sp. ACAM 123]